MNENFNKAFLFLAEQWKMLFWIMMFSSFSSKHQLQINTRYQSFHEQEEEKKKCWLVWIVKVI